MLASELFTQVRAELLEASAAFWTDAELLMWLNSGEADYINRTRLLQDTATMQTVAGRADYPLPANWLATKMLWFHKPDSGGIDRQKPLNPTTLEKVSQEVKDPLTTDTSVLDDPTAYWIWGKSIYLRPIPKDSGRTITMFYDAKPIPLPASTSSLNVDDSLADGPKNYVLWRAWSKEGETARAALAKNDYFGNVRDGMRWKKLMAGNLVNALDVRSAYPLQGLPGSTASNPLSL